MFMLSRDCYNCGRALTFVDSLINCLVQHLRRFESGCDRLSLPEDLSFQRVSLDATIISES